MEQLSHGTIAEVELPVPVFKGGEPIGCPVCGSVFPLRLTIDTSDTSDSASYMRCEDQHQWAEPRFPRRMGAEFFALLVLGDPQPEDN